jgi:hypothetical protein
MAMFTAAVAQIVSIMIFVPQVNMHWLLSILPFEILLLALVVAAGRILRHF